MNVLDWSLIRAHHWETMTGSARQDRYREKMFRARVWLRIRGLHRGIVEAGSLMFLRRQAT